MSCPISKRARARTLILGLAAVAICGASASSSLAASPRWAIQTDTSPTSISPSEGGIVTVLATNVGGAPTSYGPVTVTDVLPAGLTVTEAEIEERPSHTSGSCEPPVKTTVTTVTCTVELALADESAAGISVALVVAAEPGHTGALAPANLASVSGGGAATAQTQDPLTVGAEEPPFGFASPLRVQAFDAGGAIDSQAGGHPDSYTTSFTLASVSHNDLIAGRNEAEVRAVQDLEDAVVDLPAGFAGNPQATITCPQYLVAPPGVGKECPSASIVGSAAIEKGSRIWGFSESAGGSGGVKPLFNVTPEYGHPAQFAFNVTGQEATLYANLIHTEAGYAIRVTSEDIPRLPNITGVKVTFFGDPARADGGAVTSAPFFTNPSDCNAGPLTTTIHIDSWDDPGALNPDGSPNLADPAWKPSTSTAPAVTGCEKLQFHPEVEIKPTATTPDAPSGLNVDLKFPQSQDPTGLATPDLKDLTVTLPPGLAIDPSSANGLQACSDEQFAAESTEPANCPEPSVLGSLTARTPLLADTLHGRIFLGAPDCGAGGICTDADAQSGRMVRLLIEITDPAKGIDVKLQGDVSVDPSTGRLTAHFDDNPQLPVEELETKFKEGPTAPLSTPTACGSYETAVDLTPWSAPYTPDATLEPPFTIAGCGARGFAPSFLAGTTSNAAGTYSPLTLSFARNDNEQDLKALEATLPPGLLAKIAGVPRCGDTEANAGTCPQASEIGTVTVAAGAGSDPYTVTGRLYLTVAYNGGPFGAVAEVPAIAGPFNLGTVVVRSSIRINPTTAQATVVSSAFPQILDGIPLQVRTVSVVLNREGFTFNPTSCNPQAVTGKLTSTQGTAANVSSHYQAASCASLAFKPVFSASTAGRASKAGGASLDVKVTYPKGPFGTYANIKSVKVDLPKQLPSRLTTLQKACTAATFEANPAACPSASDVGTATATTPLLNVPLSGPAYLVSHGGEAFPDLEIVLQGEGVTLILVGNTQIKKGITSSTFKSIPDAPVSGFELKLPTGKYSILGVNVPQSPHYSLCGQKLSMPTAITGQNGAPIKQTTKIAVTGCPKLRVKKRQTKAHKK